jgi:hypothetical protein
MLFDVVAWCLISINFFRFICTAYARHWHSNVSVPVTFGDHLRQNFTDASVILAQVAGQMSMT